MSAIVAGRGKTLLALHGYGANKESFLRQIRFFSRYYKVIAVDMRGFGKSPPLPYAYSLDDYAREIGRVIDATGEKKIDILAHSFGARVAVRLLKSENRIDKIVFTGAAGLKPRRSVRYGVKRALFLLLSKFLSKDRLSAFYSADYRNASPVMKESFKKIISENLDAEYAAVPNKTLLVFGKRDKETPLYAAKRMNRLMKNSRLVVIKNAGHFCFVDEPSVFNGCVLEFLLKG